MDRPDPEQVSAGVFAALADPNRRAILASLAEHGPSTATDRSQPIKVAQSFLEALAADWDDLLGRLSTYLSDPGRG